MKVATLAIVLRKSQILLGRKQGAPEIGDGTLNGPGGKLDPGETILQCLIRETEEEVGIRLDPMKVKKIAIITFCVGENHEPDFKVHIYRTRHFTGEPRETKSMVPEWHSIFNIPYDRMLESDRSWFPRALYGDEFCANVYYRKRAKGFLGTDFFPFVDTE